MARKPKMDTILADAVDAARQSLANIAADAEIGEYLGATAEGERLVTHRFISHKKGYQGWTWFATLARVPRAKAKDLTVCEVGIIAGEGSLLAPAWVPWAERLAKEEIEAAEAAQSAKDVTDDEPQDPEQGEDAQKQSEAAPSESVAAQIDAETEQGEAETATEDESESDESQEPLQAPKSPARRQVRRRRTAQRTAARRRAAQRNRARKES
ncbi:DUF3027 domain-containing protein [Glutamicibacter sp.]|uniref:DUF3027 domain-containing protein n=1 Tax=Glutamicibacter sp. TaxID=1931995 RepID=UPI0028BD662D|nr:DUF3027 domain-containing protein [Glutamicibacter sp.]